MTVVVIVALTISAAVYGVMYWRVSSSLSISEPPIQTITTPVTVIKPAWGADQFTEGNFRSWAAQDYSGSLQLIFSFQDASDPAIPFVASLVTPHEKSIVVQSVEHGYTGKMSNLLHGLSVAKNDFLIFSDSDCRADERCCAQIVHRLQNGVDIVVCIPVHRHAANIWGRVYAQFWNFEQLGFTTPSIRCHGDAAIGITMAMSRETLGKLGGLEAFRDCIVEDVAIGRKAKELGLTVSTGPQVECAVGTLTFSALVNKLTRAALFGLTLKPLKEHSVYWVLYGYAPAAAVALLLGSAPLMWGAAVWATLRLALASCLWRRTTGEFALPLSCFVQDALFGCCFILSAFRRKTTWGGRTYRVQSDGRAKEIDVPVQEFTNAIPIRYEPSGYADTMKTRNDYRSTK